MLGFIWGRFTSPAIIHRGRSFAAVSWMVRMIALGSLILLGSSNDLGQLGTAQAQMSETTDAEGDGEPVTAGVVSAGRYLLVSSFICSTGNCQVVDAVLRYNANPGPNFGRYEGVHVADIAGPQGMAIHPSRGTLLVASWTDHAVYEYNIDTGAFLGTFIQSNDGNIYHPNSIVFMPNGDALVTSIPSQFNLDRLNGIARFNGSTGQFIETFVDGGLMKFTPSGATCPNCDRPTMSTPCLCGPAAMVYGPNGNLFVASAYNHRVIEYHGVSGEYVGHFANVKLITPTGLTLRPAGTMNAGNVVVNSKFRTGSGDFDKVVEFSGTTRQLVTTNGGVLVNALVNPGPLIWEGPGPTACTSNAECTGYPGGTCNLTAMRCNNPVLLISDRFYWDQFFNLNPGCSFSDRIRRNSGTTGAPCTTSTCEPDVPSPQEAQYFTWTRDFSAQNQVDCRLHWNSGMLMVDLGCDADDECFDANVCTDDVCDLGTRACMNPPNNAPDPDDGLFCNGVEDRCENGMIVYTIQPPNCADTLSCTTDGCNEATDQCDHILQADKCLIAGVCRDAGEVNPNNTCQECDPSMNPSGWTNSPAGTFCGDQTNSDCDRPNRCNGSGGCSNNFEPAGTPCGDNTVNACTAADTCSAAGSCLPNNSNNGTMCNDGLRCTLTDRCAAGVCVGTGSPCTDPRFPFCIEGATSFQCGECLEDSDCPDSPSSCTSVQCLTDVYTCFEFADDSNCGDNLFCNGAEVCNGSTGQCGPGVKPCGSQACDEATDSCVDCVNNANCNDGVFCNGVETCVSGDCRPGTPADCSSLNTACTVGTCSPTTDTCVSIAANEGGICNDNNPCTPTDRCSSGVCVGSGTPPQCDDGNVCTNDTCHPQLGCQSTNNTASCNDNNPCTANDRCSGGSCVGGFVIDCDDNNPCTADSCHPILGCRHSNVSGSCNDGSVCTVNDVCFGGICVGGQVVNCDDGNPCTTDTCDSISGCQHANNTDECNDGNACTLGDVCSAGQCVAGPPMNCNDGNICTNDSCVGGVCQHPHNTVSCNDGNLCTTNDRCNSGSCTGTPVTCPPGTSCDMRDGVCRQCINNTDCNDNNVCTNDVCNGGVCQRTNNTNNCNDGLACTTNDRCSVGVCSGTPTVCQPGFLCDPADGLCKDCLANSDCNDGNSCTIDTCSSGACTYTNKTGSCNDGNRCTLNDACSAGTCRGTPVNCPPGQSCDPADGVCKECRTAAECNDQDACTTDACMANRCVHDRPPGLCDDGNACTVDVCEPQTGDCEHQPRGCVYGDLSGGNCVVDDGDLLCALNGFARGVSACAGADVFPCDQDDGITMDDIMALLAASQGAPPCPDPSCN